jgi:hypothetical protein
MCILVLPVCTILDVTVINCPTKIGLINRIPFAETVTLYRPLQVATAVEEQSITCEEINGNITNIQDSATELATFATSE